MNLFFLDTETTGLPPKNSDWRVNYYHFPFLVSMAWKIGKIERHIIVHSKTVVVPKELTKIHGITTSDLRKSPHEFDYIIQCMLDDLKDCDLVVGFNTYFDTSIIKANAMRLLGDQIGSQVDKALGKDKRIDVMRIASTKLFKNKWPTLSKLYEELFNEKFQAHNALEDVRALERCYNEMKKRKLL